MLLFRCTRKALVELGLPPNAAYPTDSISTGALDVWYVNVFRYARRKCIIFTQEQTLYAVVVPGILKRDLQRVGALFVTHAQRQMHADGLPPAAVAQLMATFGLPAFAKTASRPVLGSMNDYVRVFGSMCDYDGGYDLCDMQMINSKLNMMPMKQGKGYIFPTQELQRLLLHDDRAI